MTRRSAEPREQGPTFDACDLCAFELITDAGAFTCHELACPFLPDDAGQHQVDASPPGPAESGA